MKKFILLLCISLGLCAALTAQSGEDMALLNRMMRLKMDGFIPLRFSNALDGQAVEGIGVFTTDRHGIISFPEQEDGFYTMEFSREGYITCNLEFEVKLNNVFANRFSVSPQMRGDYMRIVLDWGESPADLDLHLEKARDYHISYWNIHNAEDGAVTLDRDARRGFGPETITLMETDLRAAYRIYVIDYTAGGSASSRAALPIRRGDPGVREERSPGLLPCAGYPPGEPVGCVQHYQRPRGGVPLNERRKEVS